MKNILYGSKSSDEYMDIITGYKNEKIYYDEDIKVLKHIIQKDLKEKVKKF